MVNRDETILAAVEHLDFLAAKAGRLSDELNELRTELISAQYRITKNLLDTGRTATVRHMAADDLQKLRERIFSPNAAETAAFMNELATAQQAHEDLRQLKDDVKIALADAEKELAEIRGAVLFDQHLVLIPRWLDGERAAFEKLGGVLDDEE